MPHSVLPGVKTAKLRGDRMKKMTYRKEPDEKGLSVSKQGIFVMTTKMKNFNRTRDGKLTT